VRRATQAKRNLYLDAFDPSRLHELHRQDVGHDDSVAALAPLIGLYAKKRAAGERFGGFVIRQGFVAPTAYGRDFHANLSADLAASAKWLGFDRAGQSVATIRRQNKAR
jgi:sulfite reductase (NADPH) hemoprotein beta-component